MVALFAMLFLAGPSLDAVLCAGDGLAPAAGAAIVHHERGLAVEHLHKSMHNESPSGCQHGHVQAANACAKIDGFPAAVRVAVALPRTLESRPLPPSTHPGGLERPPRA
jgi:hypothetical protein